MNINIQLIYATLGFMLFDVLTGTLAAIIHHELNSSIARLGLWHKASFIVLIAFAIFLEWAQAQVPELAIEVPTTLAVCTFICVGVELPSIIENIAKCLPDEVALKVIELFHLDGEKFDYLLDDEDINGTPYDM